MSEIEKLLDKKARELKNVFKAMDETSRHFVYNYYSDPSIPPGEEIEIIIRRVHRESAARPVLVNMEGVMV